MDWTKVRILITFQHIKIKRLLISVKVIVLHQLCEGVLDDIWQRELVIDCLRMQLVYTYDLCRNVFTSNYINTYSFGQHDTRIFYL